MGGLVLLLALSVVMAVASFLAGALPLSLSLSQSQLRLISSIGVGILVGTSLIVIIPEGIEAIATTGVESQPHAPHDSRHALYKASSALPRGIMSPDTTAELGRRSLIDPDTGVPVTIPLLRIGVPIKAPSTELDRRRSSSEAAEKRNLPALDSQEHSFLPFLRIGVPTNSKPNKMAREEPEVKKAGDEAVHGPKAEPEKHAEHTLPTFYIGFSLVLGFVLMFLIDRIPRHATDQFQAAPATRHISLDDLASSSVPESDETEGFLGSLTPSPKQSRSLATTTGLVIHAAADGIAMGASATTANMKLGLIIFVAIMIHKAPAAFGLTSVLLKQGLSKRAARGHLIVFSLAAPVGALSTYLIVSLLGGKNIDGETGQWWTGMLLLFSAGTFLYVAMHAMQEDSNSQGHEHHGGMNGYVENAGMSQRKQARPQIRDTVATVVGMLLPLLTQFGHHH